MPAKKKSKKTGLKSKKNLAKQLSTNSQVKNEEEIEKKEEENQEEMTENSEKQETNDGTNNNPSVFEESGTDNEGKNYSSLKEMWNSEYDTHEKTNSSNPWYSKADSYWKSVDASVDGMLGGFASISKEDIRGSNEFLKEFLNGKLGFKLTPLRALDCGAGIGRITKLFLVPIFQEVDMLEQNQGFLDKAREYVQSEKLKNLFCYGMQDFQFQNDRLYDLIWIQWVTGHLTDEHFVEFFKKCKTAITSNGVIILKENNTQNGFIVDKADSSVTRSDSHIRSLFKQANLEILKVKLQSKFPKELFPVRMYAVR